MSRSLGDWDSAHCCIPTPEVRWGTVPAGDRAVFVMASDGVWDVVDMDKAAKVVRKYAPSGLAAARALVDYARSKYTASSKKDDITAVVVFVDASVPCALPLCSDAQIDQLNDLEASTAANAGRAVDGWALHRVRSSHGRPISL